MYSIACIFILTVYYPSYTWLYTSCSYHPDTVSVTCSVDKLHTDDLHGLYNVTSLNLNSNKLWTTPPSIFCSLQSLTSLNLSTNYLQEVSDLGLTPPSPNTPCLHTLKILDLSYNKISSLPSKAFSHLYNLRELFLQNNKITSLEDEALSSLVSLEIINLAGNQLVALPPDIWHDTTHLQEIYIQNNYLGVLPPGIFHYLIVFWC